MDMESELATGFAGEGGALFGVGLGVVFGTGAGEGMAGDVMLSRASGICAASGVGVEGSIGSRYGSTSP